MEKISPFDNMENKQENVFKLNFVCKNKDKGNTASHTGTNDG